MMAVDDESKPVSDQWALTSKQRIELIALLETDEKVFFEISDEIEGLVNDYLSFSDEMLFSLESASADQRKALAKIDTYGSKLLESLEQLSNDQLEFLTTPTGPGFRRNLEKFLDEAGQLSVFYREVPTRRGSKPMVLRNDLIKRLLQVFESIDPHSSDEKGRADYDYLDRVVPFVCEILGWANIPCPGSGDSDSIGEASQGRLRRFLKELLQSK